MSDTLIENQSSLGKILRTRQEAFQLLDLVQKISADTASRKDVNLREYLDTLLKLFNDGQKILFFEDVPDPLPAPPEEIGNIYDFGIASDGSMWWKDITGWELVYTPTKDITVVGVGSEDPNDFPDTLQEKDVAYTPKGRVWQKVDGEWQKVHTPIEVRILGIPEGSDLTPQIGNDNDIAVDNNLIIYQKIEGNWVPRVILNTYTKSQIDQTQTPKCMEFLYDEGPLTFQLPDTTKSVYGVRVNFTPLSLSRHYTIDSDKVVIIKNMTIYKDDIIFIDYF